MGTFIVILVVYLFIAIMNASVGCEDYSIALEVNTFSSPFCWKMGMFKERFITTDGIEDEVNIGLFFINIVFVFYKEFDA
jgi:hypothetical protein